MTIVGNIRSGINPVVSGGVGGSGTLADIPKLALWLIGQSNVSSRAMVWVPGVDDIVRDALIKTLASGDVIIPATQPYHYDKFAAGEPEKQGIGSAIECALILRRVIGAEILLVPCAVGGTYLYQWDLGDPGSGNGEGALATEAIRRMNVAIAAGYTPYAAFWQQGEADGLSGGADPDPRGDIYDNRVVDYDTRLARAFGLLRSGIGYPNLPIVCKEIGAENGGTTIKTFYANDLTTDIANTAFIPKLSGPSVDSFHYDRDEQEYFGIEEAYAAMRIAGDCPGRAPSDFTTAIGPNKAVCNWTAIAGDTYSLLMRETVASGAFVTGGEYYTGPFLQVATGISPGYEHTGLTNGTKYEFILVATNANGSEYSAKTTCVPNENIGSVQLTAARAHYLSRNATENVLGGATEFTAYVRVLFDSLPATNGTYGIWSIYGTTAAKQVGFIRLRDVGGANQYWEATLYSASGAGQVRVTWQASVTTGVAYRLRFRWDGAASGAVNQWSLEIWNSSTEVWDDQAANIAVVTDNTVTSINSTTTGKKCIGALGGYESTSYFDGRVDELDIYDDLIDASNLYYYPLDTDATDAGAGGYDLTENGSDLGTYPITYGAPLN